MIYCKKAAILTSIRLFIAPFVVPYLVLVADYYQSPFLFAFVAAVFVAAALTDIFDGYYARKYKQESLVGKVFDQIADKFFLFSMLMALVAVQRITLFIALLLMLRELLVTGIRLCAVEWRIIVPVLRLAKIKTVVQFLWFVAVLLAPCIELWWDKWHIVSYGLLAIALFCSYFSGWQYYRLVISFSSALVKN